MYVCKFVRPIFLSIMVAALVNFSLAQDFSTSSDSRPSQADCLAAANSGNTPPAGCAQDDSSSGTAMRQQQGSAPNAAPTLVQTPQLMSGRPEIEETETVAPSNPSERKKVELPLHPHTEFEQIVADTIGRTLPLFGQTLFAQPPSTFATTNRIQVPSDYVIGPDDELQIRMWGQINADLRVVVDRSGQIYIPRVGDISVAGVRYSDLDQHLKDEILKVFHNFSLTVSIGRIHSIQIFVVGQARYPGTYTISSLSTLVNAIFASGGPSPQGSLRDVQVQRDGKTIAHLDLYDLLVKGDKSKDVRLQSGDVMYYPPVGPLVAVAGSVNTPAIYEVKRDSSLADAIEIAGGLSTVADSNKITVERIGDHESRSVLEFPLDAQSRALPLNDGDIVRVLSIVPRFRTLSRCAATSSIRDAIPGSPGMRVRDLIPNAQALLTRPYWQNRAELTTGVSTEYPVAHKGDTAQSKNPAVAYLPIASNGQSGGRPESNVSKTNAETLTGDLHRASPEINWSYAIIQRVNPEDLSTRLLSFDLGKAVLEGDEANNLALESNDIITIFSQSDVAVPQNRRTQYIRLEGEIVRPGVYKTEEGELLSEAIKRAGGLTPDAYIYGTELTRESARVQQQKSIDELANEMGVQVNQMSATASSSMTAEDAAVAAAQRKAGEALVTRLQNLKATGRVVMNLKQTAKSIDDYPKITVEDNDRIVIPHVPSTVSVVGNVYNSGSFVYNPQRRVSDYLKLAGTGKPRADMKHAFVLRADGTVVSSKEVNGVIKGDKFASLRLYPGDQVVVPTKIPTGNFIRGLRDWTQISSQLAITGASLAVIH